MNGKDIFLGLQYVGEDLIELAEYGRFPSGGAKKAGTGRLKRSLTVAAVIALMPVSYTHLTLPTKALV